MLGKGLHCTPWLWPTQGSPEAAATQQTAAGASSPRNCFVTDFPGAGVTQEAAAGFHGDRLTESYPKMPCLGFIPASTPHPHSKGKRGADPGLPASPALQAPCSPLNQEISGRMEKGLVCHVVTLRTHKSRQLWAAHCMPGSFTTHSVSTTTVSSRHGALTAQERTTRNGTSLQERSLNRDKIPKPHLPHSTRCRGMS